MEKKSLAGQKLTNFISYFGVMDRLVCDRSKEHTSKVMDHLKEFRKHRMDLHITHKFVIKVPNNTKQAIEVGHENYNTF